MSSSASPRSRSHRGVRFVLSLVLLASMVANIVITSQTSLPAASIALTAVTLLVGFGLVMTRRDEGRRR